MGSTAVSSTAVSAVLGYKLLKGYFNSHSPNLPQALAIIGEANDANQSGLSTTPLLLTSASQAGKTYGYGSPIHSVARILFPQGGGGIKVPVWAYPQAAAGGAVAKVITVTPTGTATAAATIFLNIAGREILDGASYAVNVAVGDTPTVICGKFRTAIAAALGCTVLGSGTATFIATAKWSGLTSNDIIISVDLNGNTIGTTFAVVNTTAGAGTPAVTTSLNMFGNQWITGVINTYGLVAATIAELEAVNGIPDPAAPTGKYQGIIQRPFVAFSGTLLDDPTTITGVTARKTQVTIVACPAPLSVGLSYVAAANWALLWFNCAQDTPQSDILNQYLPDMPGAPAGSIPAMCDYTVRDTYVKAGCSTVDYIGGVYQVKDLVTTYNQDGEFPPFYRYVRDLNIHWNVKFGYFLKVQQVLVGKAIAKDGDVVIVSNVIKPKMWAAEVAAYADDCVSRALMVDAAFTKRSIVVTINSSNPNRLDTSFSYKIPGLARVIPTDVTAGFNFTN